MKTKLLLQMGIGTLVTSCQQNVMKKFFPLLLGLALLIPANLQAQSDDKGFFVEGSVSYASDYSGGYNGNGSKRTGDFFIITPTIGYQFNDKWSAGFKVGFSTSGDFMFNWNSYTPFVRYNFCSLGKANLFTEGKVSIFGYHDVIGGDSNFVEAGFSFGISYPLNKHLKIVCQYLHIGYSDEYNDVNDNAKFSAKHGMNLHSGDWVLDANIKRLSIGLSWTF